ncbi:MAG: TlpA family protein disulfide reductase [Deltaproteobacteria bacterium]|nr:TlpA family protein disulfide reductase [Deltaproteobacteria bacterium]
MNRKTAVALAAGVVVQAGLVAAYLAVEHGRRPDTPALQPVDPQPAPPLVLMDREGREQRLDAFRGRPVVLYFWASWCPACRGHLPEVVGEGRHAREAEVVAAGLDRDWALADRVAGGLDDVHLAGPGTADAWGLTQLPTVILVDAEGVIRARGPADRVSLADVLAVAASLSSR